MKGFRHWRWHVDEVFVKIGGETHYLWRAVDHEGEILESYVTKARDNRAENSRLPFRLRQRAMPRFRHIKSLQKFASVHANVHNHFNSQRHLINRQTYKTARSAALAEWQNLTA